MTEPHRIRTKLPGETAAILQPTNSERQVGAKSSISEETQSRDSILVILAVVRQIGSMENRFLLRQLEVGQS